ncbi:hypothetical protein BFC19_10930 [Brochothrix thermosphacta]|uniref:thioredoxin family protein n=1 Tax=Brochothrix thermosphacta TaxID=2756 RepID=UPI000E76AAB5|nr:thioredoxin family protein [Brochothrix thermosphacta]ANZ95858.1 hypothetical protein BFC19_10930 [Brochothrix thermosphacta]
MRNVLLIFSLISIIFLFGCSKNSSSDIVGLVNIKESQELSVLMKKSDNAIYFVYFGRPSCEVFQPRLEKISKEIKQTVYYFNTDEHRQSKDQKSVIDILDLYQIDRVPTLLMIKNGEIEEVLNDTINTDEIKKFMTPKK